MNYSFNRWKWLILLFLSGFITAINSGEVSITKTDFHNLPTKLFYFEDSGVILYLDTVLKTVYHSSDEGKSWAPVPGIPEQVALEMYNHPYEKDTAYILTSSRTHYVSQDKGSSWRSFDTPVPPSSNTPALNFHAERARYVIFTGVRCSVSGDWGRESCSDESYYTKDAFQSPPKFMLRNTAKCIWARSTPHFQSVPEQTVMCIEDASDGTVATIDNMKLVQSEDYFQNSKSAVQFNEEAREMGGIVGLTVIERYLVAALKHKNSDDMSLFITQDGMEWDMANIPLNSGLKQNAFTLLESSSHSLVLDVVYSNSAAYGNLYRSNFNGSFYSTSLKYTNRNAAGIVDYEKIQGVEGIVLSNIVSNYDAVDRNGPWVEKKLKSMISFDDGAHWRNLKAPEVDPEGRSYQCNNGGGSNDCNLHLHSVTRPHNFGRVFSSSGAPGIVMGVGSVGSSLLPYDQCDTFLSADGGLTWKAVKSGAHKYEFGDMGGLLVIVDDEYPTDHVLYSYDRGRNWTKVELGATIRARLLTTDSESTTQKFLLLGTKTNNWESDGSRHTMFHLNFENVLERKCRFEEGDSNGDFEKWIARNLEDGPDCIMGHTTSYWRRKESANCYVGEKFKDPKQTLNDCPCTEEDFECEYNYVQNESGKCVKVAPEIIPAGECKNGKDKYLGTSGYRLIPGNTCDRERGQKIDEPVEKPCSQGEFRDPKPNGTVKHKSTIFTSPIDRFYYFRDSSVILIHTLMGEIWRSVDEGATWSKVLKEQGPVAILLMHEWNHERAYFFTEGDELWCTTDKGATFKKITTPLPANKLGLPLLDFHPDEPEWLLFMGGTECPGCHSEAYFSNNHGEYWTKVETFAQKCIFGKDAKFTKVAKETIFCSSYKNKDSGISQDTLGGVSTTANPLQLTMTTDFGDKSHMVFQPVSEFIITDEFMAVATEHSGDLVLYVSVDGEVFAEAVFPPNTRVDKNAFTILQSNTGTIFLDIFRSTTYGSEYGTLFVSNSNGTYYSRSLENTNRNNNGLVDFEKMQGIDGTILANQVINAESSGRYNSKKKVRTMVSFDDGSTWKPIMAPSIDALGRPINCYSDCFLSLHSRTDIKGPGAIFSVDSAAGLMMGVGNVGPNLLPYEQGNTYLTRDGGRTWKEIRRGESLYEFGDYGGFLVVIDDEGATDQLLYSWDYGDHWNTYSFSDEPIRVSMLTIEPTSTSQKFLIIGHTTSTRDRNAQQVVIQVDFNNIEARQCNFIDNENDNNNDFELWNPAGLSECLLGHETEYWRRKKDRICYIGKPYGKPKTKQINCKCTQKDYQCDTNFWRDPNGKCVVYGTDPDRPRTCTTGQKYLGRSGYRKIRHSTCIDGLRLEEKIEKDCGNISGIQTKTTLFENEEIVDYYYFKKSDHTLIRTSTGSIWVSYDEGYEWKKLLGDTGEKVADIYMHPYDEDRAYFITQGKIHYFTTDEGRTLKQFKVPASPSTFGSNVLSLHPEELDWLIYVGSEECEWSLSPSCHTDAYYSLDGGRNWQSLETYVKSCSWARTDKFTTPKKNAIYCESYASKRGNQKQFGGQPVDFLMSTDFFQDQRKLLENTGGFAIFEEFMVVTQLDSNGSGMFLQMCVDGETFATAQFTGDLSRIHQAYTVLESTTHSVFLHVTMNTRQNSEFGTIYISNANGTFFTTSIESVNRDSRGLVDFEKMAGIDGIAMVNQVTNPTQANIGDKKKLRSMITHDNGRSWRPLTPPKADVYGRHFSCGGDQCSLNLHSYTEHQDPQNLFSSSSAVGLMLAVGNVGSHLTDYIEGDTFLSRDAGVTWKEIRKEAHLYEFGDHGAILILVNDEEPTDHILYSLDEGLHFKEHYFAKANEKIRINTIATEPQSTSRKFLLFGRTTGYKPNQAIVHIDFSGLNINQCLLDTGKPDEDDFELWSPQQELESKCLFGKEVQYYRRIPTNICYIGGKFENPAKIISNCTCTDHDFECDNNLDRKYDK
ncbi:vacuolar protein sorting/targeting protein PEP1 [Basidiobolus ranarum]|uniref:Vacuolar protein sorting/targeting protein PEP1 n=1 Tax=Basidiobolus ranarum TaxID=34480 RepID=A0ABR2WV80_9FUNG